MNKKGMAVLLLLATAFLAPVIAATSASTQPSNIAISQSPEDERELHYEEADNVTKIESEHEDVFEIEFSTEQGILLKLSYYVTVNATQFELELEAQFNSLVEFVDANQNGVFDQGETVQTVDLTSIDYSSPLLTNITSSDGVPGYRVESHSVGQSYDFQIVAYIYEKRVLTNATTVDPTEMKITIAISDFPYAQGSSALALLIHAESEMEVETDSVNDQDGHVEDDVEVESTTTKGYFSWSDSASVDGTVKPVNSTVTTTAEGAVIALIYPHGTTIVHDPRLGVAAIQVPGFPYTWIVVIALVTAVAALLLVVALRRARPRIQNSVKTA